MTDRHYYNCPLAAAWMCDYYEMKFENLGNNACSEFLSLCKDIRLMAECLLGWPHKYYIHPDSLHLLEPRIGDICQQLNRPFTIVDNSKIASPDMMGLWEARGRIKNGGATIILRNSVTFIWPKTEMI